MPPSNDTCTQADPNAAENVPVDESESVSVSSNKNTNTNTPEMIRKVLPIRIISKVVKGFGRGSKDLGIPTANLSSSTEDLHCKISFDALPTGIYYGFARLDRNKQQHDHDHENEHNHENEEVYKTAISIGYNPCYKNTHKTIEPHLIAPSDHPSRNTSACGETQFDDLYGETMRVSIVGYLRPELPFEGLDKLIEAIKDDIVKTEEICGRDDNDSSNSPTNINNTCTSSDEEQVISKERNWVHSNSNEL